MGKFDVSKLSKLNWTAILLAVAAGATSFVGSLKETQRDQQIEDYEERISKLEEKLK